MNAYLPVKINSRLLSLVVGVLVCCSSPVSFADQALLIDAAVLAESNPEPPPPAEEDVPPAQPDIGTSTDATYVSAGGWAVTGTNFIDAATMVFDFETTTTVSQATLSLTVASSYAQDGAIPIEVYYFADDGIIDRSDYSRGPTTPIASPDVAGLSQIDVDVTAAVNAALSSSQFIGFRVQSSILPTSVDTTQFPPWTGIRLTDSYLLDFTAGEAPVPGSGSSTPTYDGFTVDVPNIDIPGVGTASAQFRLIDSNSGLFMLTAAELIESPTSESAVSGVELLDCSAFSAPALINGARYSMISGILDVPDVDFQDNQVDIRLELIDGTEPKLFRTLSIADVVAGSDSMTESIFTLGGGAQSVEATRDFIPLCHGWVLIGDSVNNRMVERNIITGSTGATYPFTTIPDQLTLDDANNKVFMTVHPETNRLYQLDLTTGIFSSSGLRQDFPGIVQHTYGFALRDIAMGEDGNVFAILFDSITIDPEQGIPFAESGLWLALLSGTGNFLTQSMPLEEPIRIEYDPILNHVFLTTASNLATLNYDPSTHDLSFIEGTDIPVGSACTDFAISPDGASVAYSCPEGNRPAAGGEFSIVDMSPTDYFDSDGEWLLGSAPVSATFTEDGAYLIATDNEKIYFFNPVSHLVLEDFELGLLEEEQIEKIRLSRDGGFLIIYLTNVVHTDSSKFYWMPIPSDIGSDLKPLF
ncbi:MAG: hypothetical protein QGG67_15295 [Gammaproteobacteria bacterium]|jgi:hypothetical protein|nr:hypothetical protein [Gammaproteobacteria bacterium]MDP6097330.1 hypothetical protein [Gammaproteobacteria bacterium]